MAGRMRKVYVNIQHKYGITFGEDSHGNIFAFQELKGLQMFRHIQYELSVVQNKTLCK